MQKYTQFYQHDLLYLREVKIRLPTVFSIEPYLRIATPVRLLRKLFGLSSQRLGCFRNVVPLLMLRMNYLNNTFSVKILPLINTWIK